MCCFEEPKYSSNLKLYLCNQKYNQLKKTCSFSSFKSEKKTRYIIVVNFSPANYEIFTTSYFLL